MASFLEKAKSAAGAASDTVMIKAHEATIMLKKQSIKTIQSEMGVKLYPVLMKGIHPVDINPILEEAKTKVAALEAEIGVKEMEIAQLREK